MKTEVQIKEKLEKLFQKRLEQREDKYLGRNYRNCIYNLQKEIGGANHCFCTNIENPKVQTDMISICETPDSCNNCVFYSCKHTKESVRSQFIDEISNPSTCGIKEPKIAVLMWVLRGDLSSDVIAEEDNEPIKNNPDNNRGFFSFLKKIFISRRD